MAVQDRGMVRADKSRLEARGSNQPASRPLKKRGACVVAGGTLQNRLECRALLSAIETGSVCPRALSHRLLLREWEADSPPYGI